jgi:hypothetical protein
VLTYFAASQPLGFTVPMLIATSGAAVVFVVTLLSGDEGQGTRSAAHLGGGIVRRVTTKFNLRLGKELAHSVVRLVTPFRMPCCKLAV